ncbi:MULTISPECIES: tryptophan synthase subunit alpha [unclassified Caulobacter]|uniref:tryptophan synthase subunit alpha n=1 Tax=unclassified Caulobacter TaxID=2648921 RepID=UPI000D35EF0F|nr:MULTISPECIES: tryptophan synthase subunit alpha [unclassified Caulobacter]PTS91131.1 tryptophan synthase subunit alpha [Caulobacter sp. HMWF009]PTT09874.1 tryptophan synthase subunit alpha [Caulobacter sp. HMWF025]
MTKDRIDRRFAALKAENRAGFVTYIMAGDPDAATTLSVLKGLPGAGADLIELGFPFSDPMAEGPTIQRAAQRGLRSGMTLQGTLDLVAAFREGDQDTPVILMGYLNPVLHRGFDSFAAAANTAGVDGLIIVDCPPEEADPLSDALEAEGIALIRLAAPTTDDARLPMVIRRTSGFVYYVSVAGVTGVKSADAADVAPAVERLRKASGLPVAVGFGIRTPDQAAAVARIADAAVVGSALVDEIESAAQLNENVTEKVLLKASELAKAVRSARVGHEVRL